MDWLPMRVCRKVMKVNFFGLLGVTQALLQHLKQNRGSRIINMSSVAGFSALPGMSAYSASKHAVEGLAKGLKEEMGAWGVSSVIFLAFHPSINMIGLRSKSQM